MVESTFAAQECIRYLKEQRVGTCTFLPLDNITVKPVSERLRSFGQKYKLCVDLLECEDIYKVGYFVGLFYCTVCFFLAEGMKFLVIRSSL